MREQGTVQKDGSIVASGVARPVGPPKVTEWGASDDTITAAVGGGYTAKWRPDFLQKVLPGSKGICHRFYFDKRVAVDIRNPLGSTAETKKKLLYENGFGYLCIPEDYPQDLDKLRKLYLHAVKDYQAYEKSHPRPIVLQDALMIDEKGTPRKVKVTAIDTKVGGGVTGGSIDAGIKQQEAELQAAEAMSKTEVKALRARAETLQALRRAKRSGQPFRNPFVGPKGQRLHNVVYNG